MRLSNQIRLSFGFPIKAHLTQEQKYALLKRLQATMEPGAMIEVTEDELDWMATEDYWKLKDSL